MKSIILFTLCFFISTIGYAQTYGQQLCKRAGYSCLKIKNESWQDLFPNSEERDLVRRVNRMNIPLQRGMTIAIPNDTRNTDIMSFSPFPMYAPATGTNVIRVNQSDLAWGAYNTEGRLVKWGPMSGGKNYCPDVKRGCKTIMGDFTIYRRQGAGCISSKYPRPNGGAKMPYCMHFYRGFAMHGSTIVPGHHDSHGCVRMFIEDAQWLNHNFINVGRTKVSIRQ